MLCISHGVGAKLNPLSTSINLCVAIAVVNATLMWDTTYAECAVSRCFYIHGYQCFYLIGSEAIQFLVAVMLNLSTQKILIKY